MSQFVLRILVTVVEGLVGWAKRLRNRYREEAMKTAFDRAAVARSVLEDVQGQTGAGRALLLRAHNGGGRVSDAGRQLKSSVLDEVVPTTHGAGVNPLAPTRNSWQSQPLDDAYRSLLRRLVDDRVVVLRVEDMTPGVLRSIFRASGVRVAILAHVAVIGDSYLYVSLDLTEVPTDVSEAVEHIRAAAGRIRRAFEGGRGA